MQFLPVFPLQIVVFPGEQLNLHIFEPRYRELIADINASDKKFGMPVVLNSDVTGYGTEIKLLSIEKTYPTGELDVACLGIKPFKVVNFYKNLPDHLYSAADVNYPDFDLDADKRKIEQLEILYSELQEVLKAEKFIEDFYGDGMSFKIGHYVALSLSQKVKLLGIEKENDRMDFIIDHVESIMPILKNAEETKEKIKSNGHFRNFEAFNF